MSTKAGITSLKIQYKDFSYLRSLTPLFRHVNGELPLPYLHELAVVGPYENDIMTSVHKFVAERKGSISTLTIPSELEQEDSQLWESLKSLVPDLRVRDLPFYSERILIPYILNPSQKNGKGIMSDPKSHNSVKATVTQQMSAYKPELLSVYVRHYSNFQNY